MPSKCWVTGLSLLFGLSGTNTWKHLLNLNEAIFPFSKSDSTSSYMPSTPPLPPYLSELVVFLLSRGKAGLWMAHFWLAVRGVTIQTLLLNFTNKTSGYEPKSCFSSQSEKKINLEHVAPLQEKFDGNGVTSCWCHRLGSEENRKHEPKACNSKGRRWIVHRFNICVGFNGFSTCMWALSSELR